MSRFRALLGVGHQAPSQIGGRLPCLFDVVVLPVEVEPPVDHDSRHPLSAIRTPMHTTDPRTSVATREVLVVLTTSRNDPKIDPPVVELVPIDVIGLSWVALLQAQQSSMDELGFTDLPTVSPTEVDLTHRISTGSQVPPKLTDVRVVGFIDPRPRPNRSVSCSKRNAAAHAHHLP